MLSGGGPRWAVRWSEQSISPPPPLTQPHPSPPADPLIFKQPPSPAPAPLSSSRNRGVSKKSEITMNIHLSITSRWERLCNCGEHNLSSSPRPRGLLFAVKINFHNYPSPSSQVIAINPIYRVQDWESNGNHCPVLFWVRHINLMTISHLDLVKCPALCLVRCQGFILVYFWSLICFKTRISAYH